MRHVSRASTMHTVSQRHPDLKRGIGFGAVLIAVAASFALNPLFREEPFIVVEVKASPDSRYKSVIVRRGGALTDDMTLLCLLPDDGKEIARYGCSEENKIAAAYGNAAIRSAAWKNRDILLVTVRHSDPYLDNVKFLKQQTDFHEITVRYVDDKDQKYEITRY